MQASKAKPIDGHELSPQAMGSIWAAPCTFLPLFLGLALLLACSFGCAPAPSYGDAGQGPSSPGPSGRPELTEETIRERLNDTRVRDVPDENGNGKPIVWNFDEDEPKEIHVVEKRVEGDRATVVLDIKTSSNPRSPVVRHLAGQIRTEWELRTGWVLRRWEIDRTENISMKYRDPPPPPLPPTSVSPNPK